MIALGNIQYFRLRVEMSNLLALGTIIQMDDYVRVAAV